jgi:hypothetical protein
VHIWVLIRQELARVKQREADVGELVAWEVQAGVVDVVFLFLESAHMG